MLVLLYALSVHNIIMEFGLYNNRLSSKWKYIVDINHLYMWVQYTPPIVKGVIGSSEFRSSFITVEPSLHQLC